MTQCVLAGAAEQGVLGRCLACLGMRGPVSSQVVPSDDMKLPGLRDITEDVTPLSSCTLILVLSQYVVWHQ
ncbi:hypothetical protein E2C01_008862 [Portunus trituberculatus]|uniref:Uncharacterized protein n=1 Tax=Portunus trituberculatus TaxID=210409 RepID=A0A5B7D1X5_PORTR|nr:hypothetical protein [Portunus trituberculatus]